MIGYGLWQSRLNRSSEDYFLAGRNLPWIVALFSIVATETSVLTFISVPGLAYTGDWFFLQLALGYIIGRILVSIFLLPRYFKTNVISIYEVLGERFGKGIQKTASGVFLITRVLADGIRYLATAVIVQVVTGWSLPVAVLVIGVVTVTYTLLGGIRTVVWIDSFQFVLYLSGGLISIIYILTHIDITPGSVWEMLQSSGKTQIFHWGWDLFNEPYVFISALVGGMLLSFASHGVDYMMVQRVLGTRNLTAARKAMIGSGIFVFIQFTVFLLAGSLIYLFFGGIELEKDREFSTFIVQHLPIGLKGLLLAGVLSAAMSTLSSSINSLASSTVMDWFGKSSSLNLSRLASFIWAIVLIGIALIFEEGDTAIVVIGLKIASYTYGGLLGLFILSKSKRQFHSLSLIIGLIASLLIVFYLDQVGLAWTWFIGCSVVTNLVITYAVDFSFPVLVKLRSSFIGLGLVLVLLYPAFSQEYKYSKIESIPDLSFLPYVFTGLDVLEQMNYEPLQGKSIAILCNQTAVDRNKRHLLELLKAHSEIEIKVIFAPEFGLFSSADKRLKLLGKKDFDPVTGARIVDLFGRNVIPPKWSLAEVDLILVDIQDTGIRYSTYITTITKVMEVASELDIPMLVLDRPNPLRGDKMDGPVVRPQYQSFEGYHLVPIRHGLTIGEYVLMVNEMGWVKNLARVELTIIPMANWKRSLWYNETDLPWIDPAPYGRDSETLLAYVGMALVKGTNLNVGQGTDKPYFRVGAPWLAGLHLKDKLDGYALPGVTFTAIRYQPHLRPESKIIPRYNDELCGGIEMEITDVDEFDPLATSTAIIVLTHHLYPREFQWVGDNYIDKLFGYNLLRTFTVQGKPPDYLPPLWFHDVLRFSEFRSRFLLY